MPAQVELKVGDIVRLNSGGPVMTITHIGPASEYDPQVYAWCTWFKSDNETVERHFPVETVSLVEQ